MKTKSICWARKSEITKATQGCGGAPLLFVFVKNYAGLCKIVGDSAAQKFYPYFFNSFSLKRLGRNRCTLACSPIWWKAIWFGGGHKEPSTSLWIPSSCDLWATLGRQKCMIEARIILDGDNAWVAGQQTSTASVVVIWELVLNTTHIFMFKQIKFLHVKQSLHLHLHFADEQKSFKKNAFPQIRRAFRLCHPQRNHINPTGKCLPNG